MVALRAPHPGLPTILVALFLLAPASLRAHPGVHDEIAAVSDTLAAHPADPALLLRRGELRRAAGDFAGARSDYDRVEALAPQLATELALCRAALALDEGSPRPARAALDRLLREHPRNAQALRLRAGAREALGDARGAAADYERVFELQSRPDDVAAAAALLKRAGDPMAALAALDRGVAKLGSVIVLEQSAIELEVALGRPDAALVRLDRLDRTIGRSPPLLARRAEILAASGRRIEALGAWTEALEAIEALPDARRGSPAMRELEGRVRGALAGTATPEVERAR